MIVTPITDGIVIDHITCGKAMELYKILNLDELDCTIAILRNVQSQKLGRKDIIKIDRVLDLNYDVISCIDPGTTVNIIKDGKLLKRKHLELPERIEGIFKCKNPRCITSVEHELPQVFKLTDRETRVYSCEYCETPVKKK